MSSLLKILRTVAAEKIFAIFFALIALNVTMLETHAAPALDSSFGSSGIVHIGVPSGAEDTPSASALQRDGKLLLAGWTAGRQSHAFVVRLLPNGAPDATFGQNGITLFDLPNVYAIQQLEQSADGSILINGASSSGFVLKRDGKLLLAGLTTGRQSRIFVLRLLPNGVPDATFGQNGVALFDLPNVYRVQQIEQSADGSILINGSNASGLVLTRLTATGVLDTSFGTQGLFSADVTPARFVQQPDGGLLIVSDATQVSNPAPGEQFVLRLTRLNSAGMRDSTYASNGEKILSGLPPNFWMSSGVSVVAEPDGGFTVMARTFFGGSNYLLVRVTAAGTLNPGFGNGGLVSGYDVGNPLDQPATIVRTANGGLLLMGDTPPLQPDPFSIQIPSGKIVLWRVTASGLADASLGTAGRLEIGSGNVYNGNFRLTALSDDSIALIHSINGSYASSARVSHFDASGVLDNTFGVAGSATIALPGYSVFSAIDVLSDGVGGLLIPAVAGLTVECPLSGCFPRHKDAAVASLDGSGHLQTSYGRGDGFTVVDNVNKYSNDEIDTILVDASDKIVLAGTSYAGATFDYLLERLTANGTPDASFGTNGRVAPRQYLRFKGRVRAAAQESGVITVVTGTAAGSFGQAGTVTAFQLDSAGMLYPGFTPTLTPPSSANTDIALGIRPDGRLLYGTTAYDGTAILQQTMQDGTPDVNFGASGKVEFALPAGEYSRQADLVLLGDGSAVFAILTDQNLRLYKVDAHGLPLASFGTVGQFAYAAADFANAYSIGIPFSLLSLSDGSLLAGIGINKYVPSSEPFSGSLLAIRIASNGMLIGTNNLLADQSSHTWNFAALPDASVLIARNRYDSQTQTSSAALYRLLPNNSLDTNFGIGGAFPLPGMSSVSALALDANSRLLVAGQDATSAVLTRYVLNGTSASVPVVEFYNTNLDHYFITADAGEAAGIDGGSAGPGWVRTGNSFKSGGSTPACRFYGSQVPGPNSHFYTLAGTECDGLKQLQTITPVTQKRWNFESLDFISTLPTNGACPTGTTPIYRAYNNGFARGVDSNHRLSSSAAAIQEVVARGWINEGVVMCAPI